MISYRHPIVTLPLSLRVSEILPLLCSSMPLFPSTSNLPKISPCSPGSSLWATKSEGVGLIVRAVIGSKISKLCCPDPQTDGRTDGQTDGRRAIAIPRYALRAVKCVHCSQLICLLRKICKIRATRCQILRQMH